jgi:hypothetical protein
VGRTRPPQHRRRDRGAHRVAEFTCVTLVSSVDNVDSCQWVAIIFEHAFGNRHCRNRPRLDRGGLRDAGPRVLRNPDASRALGGAESAGSRVLEAARMRRALTSVVGLSRRTAGNTALPLHGRSAMTRTSPGVGGSRRHPDLGIGRPRSPAPSPFIKLCLSDGMRPRYESITTATARPAGDAARRAGHGAAVLTSPVRV